MLEDTLKIIIKISFVRRLFLDIVFSMVKDFEPTALKILVFRFTGKKTLQNVWHIGKRQVTKFRLGSDKPQFVIRHVGSIRNDR